MEYDWTGERARRSKLTRNITVTAVAVVLITLLRLWLR